MTDSIRTQIRQTTAALMAVALVLSVLGPVGTAAAVDGITVSQQADATTVSPGDTITFTTEVGVDDGTIDTSSIGLQADLPDGWTVESRNSVSTFIVGPDGWLWFGGPSGVSGTATAEYTVTVPEDAATGTYDVSATASTEGGASTTDTTTITVEPADANTPPTADASADQTVDEESTVTLDASASTDSDGDALSYQWTQTGGPDVSLSDAGAAQPTFTAPALSEEATLTFDVTVSDGNGGSATDSVSVTVQPVNAVPTASIGGPTSAQVGDEVTFTASASDDGSIASYEWDFDGDGQSDATGQSASYTFDAAGSYDVELTVTDDEGAATTATQTVSVTEAAAPASFQVSDLSAPATATQGETVTVTATVENTGDEEATQTVEFAFDGSVVDSTDVTLAGGASQQVEFAVDTAGVAPGTYSHGVSTEDDSATAQIAVTQPDDTPTDTPDDDTPTDTPDDGTPSSAVSLQPADELVAVGDSATYDVVVEDADGGVGAYAVTVTIDDPSVASITDVELNGASGDALSDVQISEDGSSVTIDAVVFDTADDGAVTLGTVTVESAAEGTTGISLDVSELGNEQATPYEVTATTGATLEASTLVVGDSGAPAQDLDGDGDYEDVNGDGSVDMLDVQTLFADRNGPAVTNSPAAFDYNGDGEFSLLDVLSLFVEETG